MEGQWALVAAGLGRIGAYRCTHREQGLGELGVGWETCASAPGKKVLCSPYPFLILKVYSYPYISLWLKEEQPTCLGRCCQSPRLCPPAPCCPQ